MIQVMEAAEIFNTFLFNVDFHYFYLCGGVYVYTEGACGLEAPDPQELESQSVVSCLIRVLGKHFRFFGKPASAFDF